MDMGTQNKRFESIGYLNEIEANRVLLQYMTDNKKSRETRRKLGQFATPYALAQEIVTYGLKLLNSDTIDFLEPAIGTGTIYSALLEECEKTAKRLRKSIGFEIDDDFFFAARKLWESSGIKIEHTDFTEANCDKKVNFLISNPPYVRHQCMEREQKERLYNRTKSETGYELSGLAGLYCYFILLSHKWLAPGAICGWLIPSEFMDVNYGEVLKDYFLNTVHLLRIHRYDPQNSKFDDALVSSCVVWFKNEVSPENYDVELSFGGTHEEPDVVKKIDKITLQSRRKWTVLVQNKSNYQGESEPVLGDFFRIKRGLATGDNDFFILSKKQIEALGLESEFLVPILPSPRYLKDNEIFRDQNGYPCLETQYFLLDCTLTETELKEQHLNVWKYLDVGRDTVSKKYLCKNRKVWYFQEKRSVTPFLCSYMGRKKVDDRPPFRFILNHSNAIVTNAYLMLYPKNDVLNVLEQSPDIINEIWGALSDITASDFECESRIYGGGLKKIEPRELSLVRCSQLAKLLA